MEDFTRWSIVVKPARLKRSRRWISHGEFSGPIGHARHVVILPVIMLADAHIRVDSRLHNTPSYDFANFRKWLLHDPSLNFSFLDIGQGFGGDDYFAKSFGCFD